MRGEFNTALDGMRNLRAAGVPIEINYSPTSSTSTRSAPPIDLAYELGAYSFYTGRTMYTGNAVKTWHKLALTEEQYDAFFATLHQKTDEYRGRMRVHFHEMGLLEELRYRLHHPAALLIVLPNGLVKLINALPFICGDLRRQSLTEIWANFQRAWQDPRVAQFVARSLRRSRQDVVAAPMGASMTATPGDSRACGAARDRQLAARSCTCVSAWCATASFSTPVCCRTASARRGRTRSPARSMAPIFWSGLAGVVLAVDRRRGLQRILRLPDGHGPRIQPGGPASDVERRHVARHRRVRGSAGGGDLPAVRGGWPILAFALAGRHGRDLLCRTPDSLGLSRPGRDSSSRCRTGRGWCWEASISTPARCLAAHCSRPWCRGFSSCRSRW